MSTVRPSNSGYLLLQLLRQLEMLSAAPRASLTLPSCSHKNPRASRIGWTHARHCPFLNFTITAEIHARSLPNFYGQYAERHMNLKFLRRVSEQARAIRPQFIIVKNKLMSVFNESVLLLTMNFVITLSKQSADPQLL